jgi:NAD(P)-dependent dehydrogenase (short-subunit alcohol dehydrogenase family)
MPIRSSFLMDRQVRSPTVARLRYGSTVASGSRVVLVTGGTRGIGRAICDRFVADGATVVTCGRKPPEVPSPEVEFQPADVRDPDQVAQLIEAITEGHGRLDVVINNAGGSPYALAADASPRFSTAIITLNLIAPLHVAQAANRVMQQQEEGGVIVNIGSVSGIRPSPGTAAYGAAKAGLINLTATLAVEWAPKVRVNCVTVGLVKTEQSELHYGDAEGVARVAATVPLGRMAEPHDVADTCAFLSSPAAAYISGANVVLHGGGERPAFLDAANVEPPR